MEKIQKVIVDLAYLQMDIVDLLSATTKKKKENAYWKAKDTWDELKCYVDSLLDSEKP